MGAAHYEVNGVLQVVVDEDYVVRIPDSLDLAKAAPLLCAGAVPLGTACNTCARVHFRV